MTLLAVTYGDVERLIVDHLTAVLAGQLPAGATIGVDVPASWVPTSPMHVQVLWDGTPTMTHPIVANPTVRVVVRSGSTTLAKRYALLIEGLLCAGGWPDTFSVQPLTGVLPASDPATRAALASFTVRVNVRSTPITAT